MHLIQTFIVHGADGGVIAAFYTDEEAIRFIAISDRVHKQDTSEWTYKEYVLANNADKLAYAMYKTRQPQI